MICVQCAAGGGGILVAIMAAIAAVEGAEWVLARIWWILGAGALCAALAAAGVLWLMRWTERRDARRMAAWRAERWPRVSAPAPAQLHAGPAAQLPRAERPVVIENHWHEHHHYAGGTEPARATAIPGQAGDAITEGK